MTALATLDDVAAVSRAVPEADETQVERLLEMVSARVRRYTGLTFDKVTDDTATVYPVDGEVVLPQWPVTAATATRSGTAVDTEVGSSGRIFRTVNGIRRAWPPGRVDFVWTHGWDTVPDDIVMVVAEVAAERWNASATNPTQIAGASSQDVAGYSESTTFRLPADSRSAWSAAHLEILDAYRQPRAGSIRLS